MSIRTTLVSVLILGVASMAAGLMLLPQLQGSMAINWNTAGQAVGFGSRYRCVAAAVNHAWRGAAAVFDTQY